MKPNTSSSPTSAKDNLRIRLSSEQRSEVQAAAAAKGLSLATFIRAATLAEARKVLASERRRATPIPAEEGRTV